MRLAGATLALVAADVDRAAQVRPGEALRFRWTSP
jgi:allophanate hydrolase subunit 2